MTSRMSYPRYRGRSRPYAIILATVLPVVASGCAQSDSGKASKRTVPTNYVQGSFVVTADSSTTADSLKSSSETVASELGCRVAAFDQINWGSSESTGVVSQEMRETYNVRFENCDFSKEGTSSILKNFEAQSGVTGVEAEALATASPIKENDPDKKSQGHLSFIKRDQACNASGRENTKPIIVAVVDSGVDIDHPDLKDMFLRDANGRIIGANFVGAGSQMPPDDNWNDNAGHGTHVAGLIGGMANNGQGIVGVGSCANIKIMPIRVLNDEGTGTSIEIERGVKWAADKGAHIINLSLGYTAVTFQENPKHYRSLYADLAKKDVVVFAAAGNDGYVNGSEGDEGGRRFHYPSSYENVISVAATDNRGSLTSFSNRGELVDIAAPGLSVLSTTNDGRYGRMSGTSMATPVVAGAYALALASASTGLDRNVDRIDANVALNLLKSATLSDVSLPESSVASAGVLDVEKLVTASMAKYPKVVDQPQDTPTDTPDNDIVPVTPITPTPVEPQQPAQPIVQNFEFVGLKDGQKAGLPQALEVKNLPTDTYSVSFYWGTSYYAFTKVLVRGSANSVKDADRWYLYGNRTLTAVAFNKNGRVLKQIKVNLVGY
jgi:subtilisin family serine protease